VSADRFQWYDENTYPDPRRYLGFTHTLSPLRPEAFVCITVTSDWRTRLEKLSDGLFTMFRRGE
jgi:hypothetical protein